MTDKERIKRIVDGLLQLHRAHLRVVARLKAIESFMADKVPVAEQDAWYKELDEQTNRILQAQLEDVEAKSPFLGGLLDDRGPDELEGLGGGDIRRK